jgi:DNA-binding MarR family transcriptional regulator
VSQPSLERLSAELVVYAGRLVRAVSRRAGHDVPAATLRLLSQVDELGPTTIGHLAQADRCSQPTMSSAVQNLVDKGWAAKQPNPADARSSLVHLTDAGREALGSTRRKNAAVVAARLEADPQHDVQDLETAVALLRGLLEQHPEEGSK